MIELIGVKIYIRAWEFSIQSTDAGARQLGVFC